MKFKDKLFPICSLISSYIFLGLMTFLKYNTFEKIISSPLAILLMCMTLFTPSIILYFMLKNDNKLNLLRFDKKTFKNSFNLVATALVVIIHFAIILIFRQFVIINNPLVFIIALPITATTIGFHELGWDIYVRAKFEDRIKFWKSNIATGLYWGLWFFPFLFIVDFPLKAQYFGYLCIYLIGIKCILSLLRERIDNLLLEYLAAILIFSFHFIVIPTQGPVLVLLTAVEVVFLTFIKDIS